MKSNRYAGAASVVAEGRNEAQRLLMEKYRRIDVSENIVRDQPVRDKYAAQYKSRAEKHENDTRYYIPMSQKGSRPIKYSNAGD